MKVVHKKVAEKQKSLLVYADWNCTTGFGAVAKELVNEWAKDKKLSIVIFAINDKSKAVYDYLPNVKVIPALQTGDKDTRKDSYRRIELLKLIYQNDFDALLKDLVGCHYSDEDTVNIMRQVFKNSKYCLDPHGAVGYLGLKQYLNSHSNTVGIFLETAHPVKFKDVV